MQPSYQQSGIRLVREGKAAPGLVKELQRDLRRLGYLRTGIDGSFGRATEEAIKALQFDLLHNAGKGPDGRAPVRVTDYNRSRVTAINGILDEGVVAAIAEMLADEKFTKLPYSPNAVEENARIVRELGSMRPVTVPVPFLLAVLEQESGLRHYSEPSSTNEDSFVLVGLDKNNGGEPAVTSRGYGIGQHTLFHHPATLAEANRFILDARGNVQRAIDELSRKFRYFINGRTPGTQAADRSAEYGAGPLRICKFHAGDPRRLAECQTCLRSAGQEKVSCAPTPRHAKTEYEGVPVRKNIGCDWPYAVRRYNGSGLDSYHYQARILLRVLNG